MKLKYIIFTIAFITIYLSRYAGLDRSPISLNYDEASLGYNAYSLMQTGQDEYGATLPLSLRSFNDYKPALYSYLTIPFYKIFGVNQASVRLPSAFFGTVSLLFFFLIFKQISQPSFYTSLLITLFISFLPWRLHYSRVAFESNLSMSFFTIMFWYFFNRSKNIINNIFIIFFALLSIYSYHAARLAVPLALFLVLIDPLEKLSNLKKASKLWPLFWVIIFSIPIFIANHSSSVLHRFDQTSIFSHFTAQNNQIYYLLGEIVGHALSYLSPRNLTLVIYHWVTNSAQNMSGTGVFGWLASLFLIIGLGTYFQKAKNTKEYRFLAYWLIAGASPVAATFEWFHPLRCLNSLPALEIICGLGILFIFKNLNKYIGFLLVGIMLLSSIYNLNNELNYAIYDTNGQYQPGGYQEGADLLNQFKDQYQTVYLDSPHAQSFAMFLFYLKYPPTEIQKYASIRPTSDTANYLNFNFDNFVYKKFDWPQDRQNNNFVYWTSSEVKENEINSTPGAHLYKITNSLGWWVTSIITKE
jgi:4-amino-4-deoxy-L-arabinose transferase-like glycosyltransferase